VADLSREQLRRLAHAGAQTRLQELGAEEAAIRRAFPDLAAKPAAAKRGRRRRSRMSAAARKAVSQRMKKYWAERRKAKGKK
jgi:hypothetical protein